MTSTKRKHHELSSSTEQLSAFAWRQNASVNDVSSDASNGDISEYDERSETEKVVASIRDDSQVLHYDSPSDGESDGRQPANFNVALSNWRRGESSIVFSSETSIGLTITKGQTITILGQYDLWVRQGVVEIAGAILCSSPTVHRIFSPSTHALLSIRCISGTSEAGAHAEIQISDCQHSLRGLGRLSPFFSRIWNKPARPELSHIVTADTLNRRNFHLLYTSADDELKRPLSVISVDVSWETAINTICSSTKALRIGVCGPKGTGKSTFGRILGNRLMTRLKDLAQPNGTFSSLCWLDIDPGQPEFSPPGQVSLIQLRSPNFGPPFTHPFTDATTSYRMIHAHNVGSLTPKDDPDHYLACITDLLDRFECVTKDFPNCPLIVNYSGWVLGHALEVTSRVIKRMKPTNIVYTSTAGLEDVVQVLMEAARPSIFHRITSHSPTLEGWHAADLRTMQLLSYFHQKEPVDGHLRWNMASITSFRPWELSYAGDGRDILAVQVLQNIGSEFLCTVLDGCLVSIVVLEDTSYTQELELDRSPEGIPCWLGGTAGYVAALDPKKSHLVGLGLVSRIDAEANTISMWTPLSENTRQELSRSSKSDGPRTVLVRGSLDAPGWAYLEDVYLQEKVRTHTIAQKKKQGSSLELAQHEAVLQDLTDADSPARPWLRSLQPGEKVEKRWKVRRNLKG